MRSPNRRLLQILALGWLAFVAAGVGLRQVLRGPSTVVVIDRSYCEPSQWQQVADAYTKLYERSQARELQIKQVILLSDLGQEVLDSPPEPAAVRSLSTYGRANPSRLQAVSKQYPQATVLTCSVQKP